MWEAVTLETLTRFAASLATAVGLGSLSAQAWIGRGSVVPTGGMVERLRRLQVAAALAGVAALVCRAAAHTVSVAGDVHAVTGETWWLVLGESRWGHAWRWPMGSAVLVGAVAWRHRVRPAPLLSAIAFALACAVTPRLGHGAGSTWQAAGHALHVAATGVWLGTVLAFATLTRAETPDASALTAAVGRFSPWALGAALATLASGSVLAVVYVGTVDAVVTSHYGRWLLIKLAIVAAIALCGYGNWQRVRAGRRHDARLIRAEAALAVVALAVTALLGETAHP